MNICKHIVLIALVFVLGSLNKAVSSEQIDFDLQVVQMADGKIDITVTITSGEGEYTYSLWNKEPWENGRELENSGETYNTVYTFNKIRMHIMMDIIPAYIPI